LFQGRFATRYLAASALAFLIHGAALSATIDVPADFPTIQDAIDAAANGDCIIVQPGTYNETLDIDLKSISLISAQGPGATTICGNQSCSVIRITNQIYSPVVVDGFTITGGYAKNSSASSCGGAIYCFKSLPIIINNQIVSNAADSHGGEIYCWRCTNVVIANNAIKNNLVVPSNPHGSAGSGGGVMLRECRSASLSDNTIRNNGAGEYGAGIFLTECAATVSGNIIAQNDVGGFPGDACTGGGVCCEEGTTTLVNNIIVYNEAMFFGGGIAGVDDDMLLVNNTVAFNRADLEHGGLSYVGAGDSAVEMADMIFWKNESTNGNFEIGINGKGSISYSDVEGGLAAVDIEAGSDFDWGSGMIDADPLFADSDMADFHLTAASPCADSGLADPPGDPLTDFEGDDRYTYQVNTEQDMGADEFFCHVYSRGSIFPGSTIELKFVGWPTDPVTLALSDHLLSQPYWTSHGYICVGWPPLWSAPMGTIPGDGILTVPFTVPSVWSPGDEFYLQALVGSWGGQPARLTTVEFVLVE